MSEKSKKLFSTENICKYGIMIVLMGVMSYILYDGVMPIEALSGKVKILFFLAGVLVIIFAGICMVKFYDEVHKFYIIIFLLVGLFYFFIYPIGTVPDEYNHFYRAYEISEGHMVSDINENNIAGRDLPGNLKVIMDEYDTSLVEMWNNVDLELSEEREYYSFWTMSLYAPVSYAPQSLGIFIARLFTKSVVLIFAMGRLFNFISIAIVSYFAVKYIPVGKKIIALIMLLPVNMQEAISLAPDTMVTALTMAFIAFILHLRYTQKDAMSKKQLVLLYIMAIAISLYKIVYIPFCMLPFLIPAERFGGKKQFTIHAVCMAICVIATGLGWLSFAGRYLMDIDGGRDSDAQVAYILSDIPNYFRIMWATLKINADEYFYTMIGSILSWGTVSVPKGYLILYAIMLGFGIFQKDKMPEKFGVVRGLLFVVVIAVFLLIMTSLYVQWTNHKSPYIDGVQGRYFIPLLLPVLLIVSFCVPQIFEKIVSVKHTLIVAITISFVALALLLGEFISQEAIWERDSKGWKYNVLGTGYVTESWYEIGLVWYYFDEEGYALSNEWRVIDGKKYYFTEACYMLIGWKRVDGEWYYCANDGSAYTGWVSSSGEWYYCEDGKMLYDCITPDGYELDAEGKRIEK